MAIQVHLVISLPWLGQPLINCRNAKIAIEAQKWVKIWSFCSFLGLASADKLFIRRDVKTASSA